MKTKIIAIAATDIDGKIGDNGLEWKLKDDLAFFKQITYGCPVIMGRKTFDTLNRKPLSGRLNVVISRSSDKLHDDILQYDNISYAIADLLIMCYEGKVQADKIFIIGGHQIYEQSMSYIDKAYITKVNTHIKGELCFPKFNDGTGGWEITEIMKKDADEYNEHSFSVYRYDKLF